jgi:hypothetical protein
MKYYLPIFATSALLLTTLTAVEVEVQRAGDPYLPWGYDDTTEFSIDEDPNLDNRQNYVEWDHARSIQVSEAPYVDYFVAFNSGVAGVLAEKRDAPFLNASESTISQLSGGANGGFVPDFEDRRFPDRYTTDELPGGGEKFSAFASWTDGVPLPAATSWYGVSWGGLPSNDTAIEEMEVRVNLASPETVNVAHLFNDGQYYSSDIGDGDMGAAHTVLGGHEFTVTHYAADGSVIDEQAFVLPSGGFKNVVSPKTGVEFMPPERDDGYKQFYTALISATRQAEGDYLILKHRAGNIGYRMTLVTLGDDRPWAEDSVDLVLNDWSRLDFSWVYGLTEEWGISTYMGYVYVPFLPYVYQVDLGWLFYASSSGDNHYFYSFDLNSYILINEGFGGFYYNYATDDYTNQIPQP